MKEKMNYYENFKSKENPFSGDFSGYGTFDGSELHSVYPKGSDAYEFHLKAHTYFRELILDPEFACIAGQSVVRSKNYAFSAYNDMTSAETAEGVCHDLVQFKNELGLANVQNKMKFMSFVAAFENPVINDQMHGAEALYSLLKSMHVHDKEKGFEWDGSVSSDIHSDDFSYSASGDAFFIPLLYEYSASPSRKSNITMVVFNAHSVFDKLRENGAFDKLKMKIRARQPWIHPHLGDHGQVNEFRQYALVDSDMQIQKKNEELIFQTFGKCPFEGE